MDVREYIKKIILETFFVNPEGQAMTMDQFKDADPGFAHQQLFSKYPIEDIKGTKEIYTLDSRIGQKAVKEINGLPASHIKNISSLIFSDDTLLSDLNGQVTFDNIQINLISTLNKQENIEQGLSFLGGLGLKNAEKYLIGLMNLGDEDERQKRVASGLKLSKETDKLKNNEKIIFQPEELSSIKQRFFRKTDNIGMGATLVDYGIEIMIKELSKLNNQTPIEFSDKVLKVFIPMVDKVFENMPHLQKKGADDFDIEHNLLKHLKEEYIEVITYVTREIIGELNFELLYYGYVNDIPFKPSQEVINKCLDSLPLEKIKKSYGNMTTKEIIAKQFRPISNFDYYNPRDCPNYYNTKFSYDKNAADLDKLKPDLKTTGHRRMGAMLSFSRNFYDCWNLYRSS